MLHSPPGAGVNATQLARVAPVYELNARLALRFEVAGGRTRMCVDVQEPPWKVIRAFQQANGAALVHLHNLSGGVLAGDHLYLEMAVGHGAVAQVTSTGATRLYKHRPGASDSEHHISISVAEGALLEYLPDALIPFAGTRHAQRTTVCLADKATFFWWEVLAPGRQAMDEVFLFENLRIEIRVQSTTRPLLLENYQLQPLIESVQSIARIGPYTHTASFYAFQVGRRSSDLRELESKLSEVARESSHPGVTIWGVSALAADGVLVRGLSVTARDVPATLARFWKTARLFLTGEEAVPPRKIA